MRARTGPWGGTVAAVGLLALQSAGCVTDRPDAGRSGVAGEPFVPQFTGTAWVPYSSSESMALVDPETACTVDSYEVKIVCVERSGRMLASFGREGDGPGELRRPGGLVRGVEGTVGFTDGGTFHVFTPSGVPVLETVLPTRLLKPVSPFGATVTGTFPLSVGSVHDFSLNLAAVEIDLETGEILDQWRPGSIPVMECGVPAFGFPSVGEKAESAWVFMGCGGQLAFAHGSEPATVIWAPTHVEEMPNRRDVTSYRERQEGFGRMAEQMLEQITGRRPTAPAVNIEEATEASAGRPKRYYLQRGQETYDSRGRLWISTARDRDEESFLDVYADAAYYGTVRVRDRIVDFDIIGRTLAVLVERGIGPEDADGVPDRAIDWYDISGF